jgi:drug/metabolite transporter (DMT)-like permease
MWIIYAILAAILWGLNYAVAERILKEMSAVTLLAFEMFIGGIVFFAIGFFMDLKTDWNAILKDKDLATWVIVEIITIIIANFLITYTIQSKNGTIAGLVELIYPIFTVIFSWFLFKQYHLNPQVVVGGVLIMLGVAVINLA